MKKLAFIFLAFLTLTFFSFRESPQKAALNIIPKPVQTTVYQGNFKWNVRTRILVEGSDSLKFESHYLADKIKKHAAFSPEVVSGSKNEKVKNVVILRLDPTASANPEGYQLEVGKKSILIQATKPVGIFYGIQSLLQLMPSAFFAANRSEEHTSELQSH